MSARRHVLLSLALGLQLAACGEPATPDATPATRAGPPSADAFCAEHGVAEAVCTKCNPKLALIFQEKGDWCAEHGLPESFCPICHPERGGRPAADLGAGAPAEGTLVQLAGAETARRAGIETVAVQEAAHAAEIVVLGAVRWDDTRRAEVNARLPGVVREVLVELGATVAAGDPLARIESAELGAQRAALAAAEARVAAARPALERAQALLERGMGAVAEVQAAQREHDAAAAERGAASAALGLVGALDGTGNVYTLTAPLPGTCVRRPVTVGRLVDAEETVCEIVDTSSVWVELDVPEGELGRVRAGQTVVITADALGGRELRATIDHIAPEIDPHTRSARARLRLPNPDGVLRANLFVRARIVAGDEQARALVPRDAVQRAKGAQFVFVEVGPGRFEARRAQVLGASGPRGELLALAGNLRAGDRVATAGSFLLKTEILKGEIGAGCCVDE